MQFFCKNCLRKISYSGYEVNLRCAKCRKPLIKIIPPAYISTIDVKKLEGTCYKNKYGVNVFRSRYE